MKKKANKRIPCECLDFVEASHRQQVYPLIYCHMKILGHLNNKKVKQAVSLSSKVIPEILYVYDFKRNVFVNKGYTADDVVKDVTEFPISFLRYDLSHFPQLQILIRSKGKYDYLIVVMSHLLADGEGFLQYLYLLAELYNGKQLDLKMKNQREISFLLENICILPETEQTKIHKDFSVPALRAKERGNLLICVTKEISKSEMERIHQKAALVHVTLNDIFMTAYARVIARIQNIDVVVLPCPADLRKFYPGSKYLTVANMTGIYRRITVENPLKYEFTSTLQQLHIEMLLQKSRRRCFIGIKKLNKIFHYIPYGILSYVIRAAYKTLPVSYTNFGIINHEKISFKECFVQNCFMTGTYRIAPDFQLSISTFRETCTLNCTLIGNKQDERNGQYILEQVKHEILAWINN